MFNPNQTHVCCVSRHSVKLCSNILRKGSPKRNVIKENHDMNKFSNYLLVECAKFCNGISIVGTPLPDYNVEKKGQEGGSGVQNFTIKREVLVK